MSKFIFDIGFRTQEDLSKVLTRIPAQGSLCDEFIERSTIPYSDLPMDEHDHSCHICESQYGSAASYNDLLGIEKPVRLTCGHFYGHICLGLWLARAKTCPTCRTRVNCQSAAPFLMMPVMERLPNYRRWLLWIIQRHGIARGKF